MTYKASTIGGFVVCALLAGLGLATRAAGEAPPLQGTWSLNNWVPGDSVHLEMKRSSQRSTWTWGNDQPLGDLHGLTLEQLHAVRAPVSFTMRRDAGAFAFQGTLTLGIGRGTFQFTPDPNYAAKLGMLGYENVAEADLFGLALRDVSLAYAGEVKLSGVRVAAADDLVRLLDHGVSLDFIRALAASGCTGLSAEDVVRLHDHGVDGEFVGGLKRAGQPGLSADEIIRLRDHGVDPAYVARIRSAGYGDLTVDQIVKLHDHGVD